MFITKKTRLVRIYQKRYPNKPWLKCRKHRQIFSGTCRKQFGDFKKNGKCADLERFEITRNNL